MNTPSVAVNSTYPFWHFPLLSGVSISRVNHTCGGEVIRFLDLPTSRWRTTPPHWLEWARQQRTINNWREDGSTSSRIVPCGGYQKETAHGLPSAICCQSVAPSSPEIMTSIEEKGRVGRLVSGGANDERLTLLLFPCHGWWRTCSSSLHFLSELSWLLADLWRFHCRSATC